ncbi:MAG: transcriptional regulator [Sulfobacillus acidophilus]|uniref:Transcriptional regulator n=1 Tax=Sulfobacillus acidophilus TaxID=53633 RepID=A0A2T2WES2_9FIRM|nr:MAG: transcriptional regulator [Sulfobacillus acidophilus]
MKEFDLCPRFEAAVGLIGKRWTGLIIEVLLQKPQRFSEIAQAIEHVSDRMLAERLKELEAEGIVDRHVYPETPVRVEYSLTDKGRDLAPVMQALHNWANSWILAESMK